MSGSSKQYELVLIKTAGEIQAEVRFHDWDDPGIKKFGDLLSENIKNSRNLGLFIDDGYPTDYDKVYILLEKPFLGQVQTAVQTHRKEFPGVPEHPGFMNFLFGTKKYKDWKEYIARRRKKEKEAWDIVEKFSRCEISTSHDYPWLFVSSSIHTEDQLISDLRQVAESMNIVLQVRLSSAK